MSIAKRTRRRFLSNTVTTSRQIQFALKLLF